MMGLGLFFSVLMVWQVVQAWAFQNHPQVVAALGEAPIEAIAEAYTKHGDVVAHTAGWGGAVGAAMLLFLTWFWKRKLFASFLGFRLPELKKAALWSGAFIALAVVLELLVQLFPVLKDPVTDEIVSTSTRPLLFLVGLGIAAPVFEELAFRGLLYGSMRCLLDKHVSIALVSAAFTFLHIQYAWPILLTQVLPLAVMLGYVRSETNSLWVPIALHVLVNSSTLWMS